VIFETITLSDGHEIDVPVCFVWSSRGQRLDWALSPWLAVRCEYQHHARWAEITVALIKFHALLVEYVSQGGQGSEIVADFAFLSNELMNVTHDRDDFDFDIADAWRVLNAATQTDQIIAIADSVLVSVASN
jgi:hypothetical protein